MFGYGGFGNAFECPRSDPSVDPHRFRLMLPAIYSGGLDADESGHVAIFLDRR